MSFWQNMIRIFILILLIGLNYFELSSQFYFNLGNNGKTTAHSICYDSDSNYVVLGTFQGQLNFDLNGDYKLNSNLGSVDLFFAKYSRDGKLIWAKNIGTNSVDYPSDIETDKYGNVYIAGYFGSENLPGRFIDLDPDLSEHKVYGEGGLDAFLIKLNSSGQFQWGFVLTNINGYSSEIIHDIEVNNSGQIYCVGSFAGVVDFNPLGERKRLSLNNEKHGYFVAKYEKDGKNIWTARIKANIDEGLKEAMASISLDNNNTCYVSANFRDTASFEPDMDTQFPMISNGGTDIFIAKYSSFGKNLLRAGFGGPENDFVYSKTAKLSSENKFYILGTFKSECDFYPGLGEKTLTNKDDDDDLFLACYSTSGSLNWVKGFDFSGEKLQAKALQFDNFGDIILSANFKGNLDLNSSFLKSTADYTDSFFGKFDNSGNLLWANHLFSEIPPKDNNSIVSINDILNSNDDEIIISGQFFGKINIDSKGNSTYLNCTDKLDLFLAKYDFDGYLWFPGGGRPTIRLISPNGGEVWNVDSIRVISWYSKNVDLIKIEYSLNDGQTWLEIADSVSASSGTFSWKVENNPSAQCLVKVISIEDPTIFDLSNSVFTITDEIIPSKVQIQWSSPSSSEIKTVKTDSKNNIIAVGNFQGIINVSQSSGFKNLTSKGISDFAIAKYNELGELIWAFNIGETGTICKVSDLAIDKNDNIYISGTVGNIASEQFLIDFSNSPEIDTIRTFGGKDAFIAKYDENGTFINAIVFGNIDNQTDEEIFDLDIDHSGNIYVSGILNGRIDFDPTKLTKIYQTKSGENGIFVSKFNSNLDFTFAIDLKTNFKDKESEAVTSVIGDDLGGFYLSGVFRDTTNFDPISSIENNFISKAETDIFIAHYKINGRLDWLTQIEGSGKDLTNTNCLLKRSSQELIIAGTFEGEADFQPGLLKYIVTSQSNNSDIFLGSYQLNGKLNWVYNFPSDSGYDKINSIYFDSAAKILACGYFKGDITIKNNDSSFIYTSEKIDNNSKIFFAKFNETGFSEFFNVIGSDTTDGYSQGFSIAVDLKNNILLSGQFFGKLINFAKNKQILLTDESNGDGFITKYTSTGQYWFEPVDTAKLYLIQPNGGEKLQAGTNYQIKWFSEYIDSLSIDYSSDNGRSWQNIVQNYPAIQQNYLWKVPNILSNNCKIKIYDPKSLKRIDISSAPFEITDKKLQITFPVGGEKFEGKQKSVITWNSSKIDFLNIYLSTDNGNNWKIIVNNLSNDRNNFSWTVPNITSEQCLIKIVDRNDEMIYDISDSLFSIVALKDSIKIIKPNGSEIIAKNQNYNVEFITKDINSVKIILKNDSLNFQKTLINNFITKDGDGTNTYNWFVSDSLPESNKFKLTIVSNQDSSTRDESHDYFSIYTDTWVEQYDRSDCFGKIKVIPNPINDKIEFEIANNLTDLNIEIYNSLGSLVKQDKFSNLFKINIDLSDLANGVYFIKIYNSKCVKLLKIIK